MDDVSESIVSLEDILGRGRGTGFVVTVKSGKQVIMTNAHVCDISPLSPIFAVYHRHDRNLRAQLKFPAGVIKKDEKHDLCMVSVPHDLKVRSLELADDVEIDSRIYIIGYPLVPLLSSSSGFIRGYVPVNMVWPTPLDLCIGKKHYIKTDTIQRNGKMIEETRCFLRAKFMFTDAQGDSGQSGSPGLNSDGEVVGVMSIIDGKHRPFAHLVPLDSLREFLSTH